ncbi:MAG: DUF2520 domain-containing protein [Microscillaceae bacterium]|nr:DUF2520 domain-containing protein [Microscillaceae bacterium]
MLKISSLGAGNVAWHLTQNLEQKGCIIDEVYSRNLAHARMLAQQLGHATATDSLDFWASEADLFILAVTDDALEEVIRSMKVSPSAILVHTSGSQSMGVFDALPNPHGVFYPLQTFSKNKPIDFSEVPFCLEASDEDTFALLYQMATVLSTKVYTVDSEQRKKLHLAAVFACNFSNHLMALAEVILHRENLDFDMLRPLIKETMEKALSIKPQEAQTGPAYRNDRQIMEAHIRLLAGHPFEQEIYRLISQSISAMYP